MGKRTILSGNYIAALVGRYDANSRQEGWNGAIVAPHGNHKNYAFQPSAYDAHITCHRFLIEPDPSVAAPLQRECWYPIVVTYNHQTFRLYKNGKLEHEQHGLFKPDPDGPMHIGRKASDEPYFFFHGRDPRKTGSGTQARSVHRSASYFAF